MPKQQITPEKFRSLSAKKIKKLLLKGDLNHLEKVRLTGQQIEDLDSISPNLIDQLIKSGIIFAQKVTF